MKIPYVNLSAQHRPLKEQILQAVARVMDHGYFILGPEVYEFEKAMAAYLGVPAVVGVNSGLDALVLALRLHGIGPGDDVITVSHSFVATASAIVLAGATPVFLDVAENTYLMDATALQTAVTPRTKAILPVHLCGCPMDMQTMQRFCLERGLVLIEDCAQAIGATWQGKMVGSFGTGCFSLHPSKILSAVGDAGLVAVQAESQAESLRRLRNHGLRDRDHCAEISYNSRLDTVQAAILNVKLPYLEGWILRRRELAARYSQALSRYVHVPEEPEGGRHVYSAYVVTTPERNRLMAHLKARGIDAKVHYPEPIHLQEPYLKMGWRKGMLPITERLAERILSLPLVPELSDGDQGFVIESIVDFFDGRRQGELSGQD